MRFARQWDMKRNPTLTKSLNNWKELRREDTENCIIDRIDRLSDLIWQSNRIFKQKMIFYPLSDEISICYTLIIPLTAK